MPALSRQLERLCELGRRGARLGLDRIEEALALLGDPQRDLRAVHVAGTNGKGSTAAMVEAIGLRAGLRVGLYTSPHLCRFNERIRIAGRPIEDEPFAAALGRALGPGLPPLSVFETLTVAAFLAFRRARVELAVLEVGLGGRLDATNVLAAPLCTAVTSIGLDHTAVLGPDLASIAREKAAICKKGAPLVVGPLPPEAERAVAETARSAGAQVRWIRDEAAPGDPRLVRFADSAELRYDDTLSVKLRPSLPGAHQLVNAGVAAAIGIELDRAIGGIGPHIEAGIAEASWPGRLERVGAARAESVGAEVLLDCAHNREGIGTLCAYLHRDMKTDPARTTLVFGALADKPYRDMLDALAPLAERRCYCRPPVAGGRPTAAPEELAARWPGTVHDSPEEALAAALGAGGLIVVTGSIFLVGAARAELLGLERHAAMPL